MSGLGERNRKREEGGEGSRAIWGTVLINLILTKTLWG